MATRLVAAALVVLLLGLGSTAAAQTAAPAPAAAPPSYPPPGSPATGYPPPPSYPPPGYPPPGYPYAPPGYPYAPPGYAPAPPPAGFHKHDGFYLRLQFGFGGAVSKTSVDGAELRVSGESASLGVAVGGAIVENLILYGTLTGVTMVDPSVSFAGREGGGNGSVDTFGVGGGVAYYFEPVNLYLAGSLLAAWLTVSSSSGTEEGGSEAGLGFEGLVGKEWWVSSDWGLGIAAQVLFASMKDKDALIDVVNRPTWKTSAFSLLFSSTFN